MTTRHITIEIDGTIAQITSFYQQIRDIADSLQNQTGLNYAEVDISE